MADDIVERLRDKQNGLHSRNCGSRLTPGHCLICEAADEITRLRAERSSLRGAVERERERCASIADSEAGQHTEDGEGDAWIALRIATAIRAQPKEGE